MQQTGKHCVVNRVVERGARGACAVFEHGHHCSVWVLITQGLRKSSWQKGRPPPAPRSGAVAGGGGAGGGAFYPASVPRSIGTSSRNRCSSLPVNACCCGSLSARPCKCRASSPYAVCKQMSSHMCHTAMGAGSAASAAHPRHPMALAGSWAAHQMQMAWASPTQAASAVAVVVRPSDCVLLRPQAACAMHEQNRDEFAVTQLQQVIFQTSSEPA